MGRSVPLLLAIAAVALVLWNAEGSAQSAPSQTALLVEADQRSARFDTPAAPTPDADNVTIMLGAAVGLLIISRARARRRQDKPSVAAADFESAYRRQHAPRVRNEQPPRWRYDMLPLRRTASRLGYDH